MDDIEIQKSKFYLFKFQIISIKSQRKKKEFVDTLERNVDVAVQELDDYKKKCDVLLLQELTFFLEVI